MSVIHANDLSHEDTVALGLAQFAIEELPAFISPMKVTTGTNADWAQPDVDLDPTAAYRAAREARFEESGGDRQVLSRLFAEHMDRVAERINSLPRDERIAAVRRWKSATGENCPRGVSLYA